MPESTENRGDGGPRPIRPDEIDWDARYRDAEQVWSGRVNGSLAVEVEPLRPGRALDVGCGEGADAIWLTERGWAVTAVDVAPTAVARGRAEAERRGIEVDWRVGDLLEDPPAGSFDLVSLQYPAFGIDRLDATVAALCGAVAAGGLLLVVGHAITPRMASFGFDPAQWVQPADIVATLPHGFVVECDELRARPGDHHVDAVHTEDVVVRARRT